MNVLKTFLIIKISNISPPPRIQSNLCFFPFFFFWIKKKKGGEKIQKNLPHISNGTSGLNRFSLFDLENLNKHRMNIMQ